MRVLVVTLIASACLGCDLPRDPEGTYERATGGTIRAGISENPPWTRLGEGEPDGIEVELLDAFAERLGARIQWIPAAESVLLEDLHEGQLDVVVGGLTDASPWSADVALTRPFVTLRDQSHVMAVPQGENRWLLELDKFLQSRSEDVERQLRRERRP